MTRATKIMLMVFTMVLAFAVGMLVQSHLDSPSQPASADYQADTQSGAENVADQNTHILSTIENTTVGSQARAGFYARADSGGVVLQAHSSAFDSIGIRQRNYAMLNIDSALSGLAIATSGPGDPVLLGTENTERVRITGPGNVGIGTSSPSEKLHLHNGNIRLSVDNPQTTVSKITSNGEICIGSGC